MEALLRPHFAVVSVFGQRLRRRSPGVLDYSGQLPRDGATERLGQMRRLRRFVFAALPLPLKNPLWRLLRGERYYPTEHEFDFVRENPEMYPVLVAACRHV